MLYSVSLSADGRQGWVVGADGTMLHLENDTWTNVKANVTDALLYSVSLSADGQHGFAVGTYDGGFKMGGMRFGTNSRKTPVGTILRLENGMWEQVREWPPGVRLYAASISADGRHGFAVGAYSTIIQRKTH